MKVNSKLISGSIGILGGAGPETGIAMLQDIIRNFQTCYKYKFDYDFPCIFHYNHPFPDMLGIDGEIASACITDNLVEALIKLRDLKMQYIVIACNTLHCFLPPKLDLGSSQLIHLPSEAKLALSERGREEQVIVFCTSTSREFVLYNDNQYFYPPPQIQHLIDKLILDVLSGQRLNKCADRLSELVTEVEASTKKSKILLGCTELSLLRFQFSDRLRNFSCIDPMEIAVKKITSLSHASRSQ